MVKHLCLLYSKKSGVPANFMLMDNSMVLQETLGDIIQTLTFGGHMMQVNGSTGYFEEFILMKKGLIFYLIQTIF
ncbi:MAG: hypothetical protein CM15mV52_0050 [uncultured marine virus]|nr:MAG: hypothetical protein CM15mV52_0050 [uncultured marine virus]